MRIQTKRTNQPIWSEVVAHTSLPASIANLAPLARNLWWVWNADAIELFESINPDLWVKTSGNPILVIDTLSLEEIDALSKNKKFVSDLNAVWSNFQAYMSEPFDKAKTSVAYFSMEYGLSNILKIYSGGLGVLAGDYLKEASDSHVDLTAVGFLYRYGYFNQRLSADGQQIAEMVAQNFQQLPIEPVINPETGEQVVLAVNYPEHIVNVSIWQVNIGRIKLYLMDADLASNSEWDRTITHQLYGGDWENRMKQEYLLGIGGIQLLNALGIKKQIYHCNEGHAALISVQRLCDFIEKDKLTFDQALEVVRASSLYTCHTPVPAGHDYFEEGLFGKYMGKFPARLGISFAELMDLGRENPGSGEKFSMSVFALNTCQEANGVSLLHGKVSQKMFAPIWKGFFPEELHVGYVTNGVHMPTWTAREWKKLYEKTFGKNFYDDQSNADIWEKINEVSDEEIWATRCAVKERLIDYINNQIRTHWIKTQGNPAAAIEILERINPNALTIGFGRRFATYKRAHLLFTDLERLSKIVNNPKYPVQFFFTGKAHPADGGGQGLIKQIVEISRRPEFLGKIIFLENYDMELAKRLVAGVDIWLNTPTRPLEASGTSGEKAEMNGVLNFSVLDGWWYEGYREGAGWALTEHRSYENQAYQDQLDAALIYNMFENEIIPLYYAHNSRGYSPEWVQTIKNSISKIAPHYTMKRMFDDYIDRFYVKLAKRHEAIVKDNYALAREMAAWKAEVEAHWAQVRLAKPLSGRVAQSWVEAKIGEQFNADIVIDKGALNSDIAVEVVITYVMPDGSLEFKNTQKLEKISEEGSLVTFNGKVLASRPGNYKRAIRVYPTHLALPHRMDMAYMLWI